MYPEGIQMRLKLWTSSVVLLLTVGIVFAQDVAPLTRPAGDTRVVRVRIAHTEGLCGGSGYCTALTTVEPSFIVFELNLLNSSEAGIAAQRVDLRRRARPRPGW